MERFFIVTKSKLGIDYLEFKNNHRKINELVKTFFKENEIETSSYSYGYRSLAIEPTENDLKKYDKALKKSDGFRQFKANSKVAKLWIESLYNNKIEIIYKPEAGDYFGFPLERYRSRLFKIEDEIYTSIDCSNIVVSEDMVEIKASEFFKIVEDYNENLKNKSKK